MRQHRSVIVPLKTQVSCVVFLFVLQTMTAGTERLMFELVLINAEQESLVLKSLQCRNENEAVGSRWSEGGRRRVNFLRLSSQSVDEKRHFGPVTAVTVSVTRDI